MTYSSMVCPSDGETFTVKELKEMLAGEEDDMKVYAMFNGKLHGINCGSYGIYVNGVRQKEGFGELMIDFQPAKGEAQ